MNVLLLDVMISVPQLTLRQFEVEGGRVIGHVDVHTPKTTTPALIVRGKEGLELVPKAKSSVSSTDWKTAEGMVARYLNILEEDV